MVNWSYLFYNRRWYPQLQFFYNFLSKEKKTFSKNIFYFSNRNVLGNNSITLVHKTRNGGLLGLAAYKGKSFLAPNSAKNWRQTPQGVVNEPSCWATTAQATKSRLPSLQKKKSKRLWWYWSEFCVILLCGCGA